MPRLRSFTILGGFWAQPGLKPAADTEKHPQVLQVEWLRQRNQVTVTYMVGSSVDRVLRCDQGGSTRSGAEVTVTLLRHMATGPQEFQIPGGAAGIIRNNGIVTLRGLGLASISPYREFTVGTPGILTALQPDSPTIAPMMWV